MRIQASKPGRTGPTHQLVAATKIVRMFSLGASFHFDRFNKLLASVVLELDFRSFYFIPRHRTSTVLFYHRRNMIRPVLTFPWFESFYFVNFLLFFFLWFLIDSEILKFQEMEQWLQIYYCRIYDKNMVYGWIESSN